jgi:hypothetical protein
MQTDVVINSIIISWWTWYTSLFKLYYILHGEQEATNPIF